MSSRYFPLAVELNSDPESWELTDQFGDRSLRIWIEVLAILEREQNHWKLVLGWESVISRKVRQSSATVHKVVFWLLAKGWLEVGQWSVNPPPDLRQWLANGWPMVGQLSASGQPEVLRAVNYAKFHKTRAELRPPPILSYPILTEPNKSIAQIAPPNGSAQFSLVPPVEEARKELKPDPEAGFLEFWIGYPNHKSKDQARKAWIKIHPDPTQRGIILGAVKAQVAERDNAAVGTWFPQWKHASSWLNGHCWEDEVEAGVVVSPPKIIKFLDGDRVFLQTGRTMNRSTYEQRYNTKITG